jgi:hypothetical protein
LPIQGFLEGKTIAGKTIKLFVLLSNYFVVNHFVFLVAARPPWGE